jgi:nucleotide-binding universal stress UspA family protein
MTNATPGTASGSRYRKIVVPLDGSGWSQRALPHAVDIARSNHSEIILLHVFSPPAREYTADLTLAGQDAALQGSREQVKRYLIGLRTELRREGLKVRTHVIEGEATARLICDFVEQEGVDLIVMCTHGRSGLARLIYGSVARAIMDGTRTPIMLVHPDRPPAEEVTVRRKPARRIRLRRRRNGQPPA